MFTGVHTAIITPFDGDRIDFDALTALVEHQIAGGIHGIVPCGTTGEASTLTDEERIAVTAATVKAARGRCRVLAGVGTNDTRRATAMARAAAEVGADGGLVITPYYNKPTQEGLYQHFRTVTEAVSGWPLVLYNVPSRTALSLTVDTLDRLADLPDIVAVKEATGDMTFDGEIVRRCQGRLAVLSGDDATALPLWAVGGTGVISVTSNLLPARMVALWETFAQGDLDAARAEHLSLLPLFLGLFIETNPTPIKTLVAWATGLCSSTVRLPLTPLLPGTVVTLKSLCADLGVLLPFSPL